MVQMQTSLIMPIGHVIKVYSIFSNLRTIGKTSRLTISLPKVSDQPSVVVTRYGYVMAVRVLEGQA